MSPAADLVSLALAVFEPSMWLSAGLRLAVLDGSGVAFAGRAKHGSPVFCSSVKRAIIEAQVEQQLNDWLAHPTQGSMLRQTLLSFVPEEQVQALLRATWKIDASIIMTPYSAMFSCRSLSRVGRRQASRMMLVPLPQPFMETFLVRNTTKRLVPLRFQAFALRLLCGILPTRHMLHRHANWPDKYPTAIRRPHCVLCNDTAVMETTWHLFADCPKAIQGSDDPLSRIGRAMPAIDLVTSGISTSDGDEWTTEQEGVLWRLLLLTNTETGEGEVTWHGLSVGFDPSSGAAFPSAVAAWNPVFAAVGPFPASMFRVLGWQQASSSQKARRWLRSCADVSVRSMHSIWCRRNEVLMGTLCELE
jgi:hypothetical protein